MSAEVDWVLDQLASVVASVATDYSLAGGGDVALKRVDRDDAQVYDSDQTVDMETPIRERTSDLQDGCYVGARLAERVGDPVGTEYDHRVEAVVGLRLEGAHHDEWGHIDPAGADGIPFSDLKRRVERALLSARSFPDVGRADTGYHSLLLTNDSDQSAEYADFYQWDADVVFRGYESLP